MRPTLLSMIQATILTLCCAVPPAAFASQPPIAADRAARAVALTRMSAIKKIKNARVTPHWIKDRDVFWYQRDVAQGYDLVLVDAASGDKRPAFDRAAMARAVAAAGADKVDPLALPVTEIALLTGDRVRAKLAFGDRSYLCTVAAASSCTKEPTAADPALVLSPDKRRAILVRDNNVVLRDMATGVDRALTTDGVPDNGFGTAGGRRGSGPGAPPRDLISWAPDSRRVLIGRVDQRHVALYPYIEQVPTDGSFRPKLREIRLALVGERPAETRWYVFDTEDGSRRTVDYPKEAVADTPAGRNLRTWWQEDGKSFLQLATTDDLRRGYLFKVDALTGAVRIVVRETVKSGAGLKFNAGGSGPPVARILGDGREAILYSARDGWGHLYLYDIATGKLKNRITQGDWLVRDIVRVDEKRRQLYFTAVGREPGNPYHRYLYRIDLDGTKLVLLTPDAGDHMIVDPDGGSDWDGTKAYDPFSSSGNYFVYDVSTVDRPAESVIRRNGTGGLVATFEKADASALFAAGYHAPEEVSFKADDGKSMLHGIVYRPSDYDPRKKYPVIDVQYGSPDAAVTPRSFATAATFPIDFFPPAATAELGFIVVVVDARGTPLRSQAFSNAPPGYLADMGLVDHVAFLRRLAARDSSVDLTRVGISGVSFGGWTSVRAMLAYPDFFKVAVAGASPGSFHSMYHAPFLTATEGRAVYADGSFTRPTPTTVPTNFAAIDNNRQVDRLKGKLLMIMGDRDENVLPSSTLQFYNAAMKADKNVDLIYVPNADHVGFYTPYVMRRVWSLWLGEFYGTTFPPDAAVPGMSQ